VKNYVGQIVDALLAGLQGVTLENGYHHELRTVKRYDSRAETQDHPMGIRYGDRPAAILGIESVQRSIEGDTAQVELELSLLALVATEDPEAPAESLDELVELLEDDLYRATQGVLDPQGALQGAIFEEWSAQALTTSDASGTLEGLLVSILVHFKHPQDDTINPL